MDLETSDKLGWNSRLKLLNAIVEKLRPLTQIEVVEGVTTQVTQSDSNTVIEIKAGSGVPEGGVPEGYVEQAVTLCVNGAPAAGNILFKAD